MKTRKSFSVNLLRIGLFVLLCGLAINLFGQSGRIESKPQHWRITLPNKRKVVSVTDYALVGTFKIEPSKQKSFCEQFWLLFKLAATAPENVTLGCYSRQKALTHSINVSKDDVWWFQSYIESSEFTTNIDATVNRKGKRWLNVFGPLTSGEEEVERELGIREDSWGITKFFKRLDRGYDDRLAQHREGQKRKREEEFKKKFPGFRTARDGSGGNVDLTDRIAKERMANAFPKAARDLEYLKEFAFAFNNNFMGRKILLRTRNGERNQIAEFDPEILSTRDIEEAAKTKKRERGWTLNEMEQWIDHKKRVREKFLKVKKAMSEAKLGSSNDFYTYLNLLVNKDIWEKLTSASNNTNVAPSVAAADEAFLDGHRMADPYPAIWGWKKGKKGRIVRQAGSRQVNEEWDIEARFLNTLLHKDLSRYQFVGATKLALASEREQVKDDKDQFTRNCYKLKVVDVNSLKLVPKGGDEEREKYISFDFAADECFIYVCRDTHLIIKADFYFCATVQEEGKMIAMDRFDDFALKKGTSITLESAFKTTKLEEDADFSFFYKEN